MKEKTIRIGNRISGLLMITFGGIISSTNNVPLDAVATMFMCEGASDLISGDHHYASSRVIKYLSRGKLNITYDYNKYAK